MAAPSTHRLTGLINYGSNRSDIAARSVKQSYIAEALLPLMETFRNIVNDCIRIGLGNNVSTMKSLSSQTYQRLTKYEIYSKYKLCAISHAAGILSNRKKSIKRGMNPRNLYAKKPFLKSCYGFKIKDGVLMVPLGDRKYFEIPLNHHVQNVLSEKETQVRSFTLTPNAASICYIKEVSEIECNDVVGVDRNLRNLTTGSDKQVCQYDLSKAIDIAENTRSIVKSFKRNDVRIRKKIAGKYGKRRKNRIGQLLHRLSKQVVRKAKQDRTAIAFEDIRHIRKLYKKGNHQGRNFRARMNSWSFAEIKRQIEYKAAWEGVPVLQLTVKDTRGTSQLCPRCGKKITQVDRRTRQLWCDQCKIWMDRDVVAAMNLSVKGRAFLSNEGTGKSVFKRPQGLAGEAVKGNPSTTVILRVDASKLTYMSR